MHVLGGMEFIGGGFREAFRLLVSGDADTWEGTFLSLWTSVLAVATAAAAGVPFGTWLGAARPRGGGFFVVLLRAGIGVPTVCVGLLLYGFLSRRGPFGDLNLLFTPSAIVIGEILLAFPIVASLAYGAAEGLDPRVAETVRTHGGSTRLLVGLAVRESRPALTAAVLLAFGRCISELGIALVAGGGIRHLTRTLPAMVPIEASNGEFGRAMAPGIILFSIGVGAALLASFPARRRAP